MKEYLPVAAFGLIAAIAFERATQVLGAQEALRWVLVGGFSLAGALCGVLSLLMLAGFPKGFFSLEQRIVGGLVFFLFAMGCFTISIEVYQMQM